MKLKITLKILGTILLTSFLIYWCLQQIELPTFINSLRSASLFYLGCAVLFTLGIIALNSIQFKLFLPKFNLVSFKRMFPLVSMFSMMVNIMPFWGGHAILVYWLGKKEQVGKAVALSILTLDQIIEGFAKLFIFGVVVFGGAFPEWMRNGMQILLVTVLVGYSILFFMSFYFRQALEEPRQFKNTLWTKVYGFLSHWAHHLKILRDFKRLGVSILLAITMKSFEVMAVLMVQKSLGVSLGLPAAFLLVAALSVTTSIPATPGRLGVFEATALWIYQYLGIASAQALALGVLVHAVHTLPMVGAGYWASIKLSLSKAPTQVSPEAVEAA